MNDDRVTRCLVCGSWMIDRCAMCAKRNQKPVDSHQMYDAELLGTINRLTDERDRARTIAVALEQENAALKEEQCGCADLVEEMHDRWGAHPAHQLAAWKIVQALRGQVES